MKKTLLYLFLLSNLCISCSSESEPNTAEAIPGEAKWILLKFSNTADANFVAVAQKISDYDFQKECFVYADNDSVSLYLYRTKMQEKFISFMHEQLPLEGSSPYIPLTDGYYLIDWKWYEFYPLTAYCHGMSTYQVVPELQLFLTHTFLTNLKWSDLTDLTDTFNISQCSKNLDGLEVIAVSYQALDSYYHENKEPEFYMSGLTIEQACSHYENYDCKGITSDKSLQSYINFCDSVQSVNQKRLIELLNNNKLNPGGYQWKIE